MNELTIESYLTELGKKDGTPGGGSAAAYVASMSAALLRMVADIQKDKKTYADQAESLGETLEKAQQLVHAFQQLAKDDAVAFEPVLLAYKLPKETPEEKAKRKKAVEEAIQGAAQPPLLMLEKSHELIDLIDELVSVRMKGTIVNDLMVSVLFVSTVLETAVLNVTINTRLLEDASVRAELEDKAQACLKSGRERVSILKRAIQHFLEQDKWPDEGHDASSGA
ncbi:Formiminotetrahydrofolate cyclodeaminase [Alkalibacterium sp. AK22]|uniref:cyclodeaminase/cyclohydrolase family protein n=1 Tax=Alkalibacterium sp. AK22 TaxID=1229520 RepID=UPI000448EFE0|nr:cyclodeaminase/cyclohydrolase family protein [Alkalibacterium sp. AK22]EXJ24015.1 Formiminotetrahydrofolate cyclodeaminase [Alkalibacterium sp. AK22]